MSAKVRNALALFRPLTVVPGVELRLHRAILYNSIYRADDQLLVNQHTYGMPAAHAPVFHITRTPGGEMAEAYLTSLERVWATGQALSRDMPGAASRLTWHLIPARSPGRRWAGKSGLVWSARGG